MNGRWIGGALTILAPAILLGVTAKYFGSNPLVVLTLVVVMIMGALYLMSYPELFPGSRSA